MHCCLSDPLGESTDLTSDISATDLGYLLLLEEACRSSLIGYLDASEIRTLN